MKALVIRRRDTDEEVRRINVTGKDDEQIGRVESGLSINFDWETYYWDEEQ